MDPVTAIGVAGSVIGIAGFGLQVATTLQTFVEATLEADERIRDIASEISMTASALQRLQAVIDQDKKYPTGRIFSTGGLESVNHIASQCYMVFKRIVELLNKAGKPGGQLSSLESADDLKLSMLDQLKWPWLEPKISRCRKRLERLLNKLLLMLQILNLANHQAIAAKNHPEKWEKEKELREVITKLQLREERLISFEKSISKDFPAYPVRQDSNKFNKSRGLSTEWTPLESTIGTKVPENKKTDFQGHVPVTGEPSNQTNYGNSEVDQNAKPSIPTVDFPSREDPPDQLPSAPEQPSVLTTFFQPPTKPHLEVYLLKGERSVILKMPLEQDELKSQMDTILKKSEKSIWEILVSLNAKDQANIHDMIEMSKKKDNVEPILKAIEITNFTEGADDTELRQIILFLTKKLDNNPIYTRMARKHLSVETLNRYKVPFELDKDNEHLIIKRWVPENEQDFFWNHTREIRNRRTKNNSQRIESGIWREIDRSNRQTQTRIPRRRLSIKALHRLQIPYEIDEGGEDLIINREIPPEDQEFLFKYTETIRETRNMQPPLIYLGANQNHPSDTEPESVPTEIHKPTLKRRPLFELIAGRSGIYLRKMKGILEPESIPTFSISTGKILNPVEQHQVQDTDGAGKVDDLLSRWTTVGKAAPKTTNGEMVEDEKSDQEFLWSTRLDDFPEEDNERENVAAPNSPPKGKKGFVDGLKRLITRAGGLERDGDEKNGLVDD